MIKWKFRKATKNELFPYIVERLDDKSQTMPYMTECFSTLAEATAVAKFHVKNGYNIRLYKELGYCVNMEKEDE